MTALPIADPDSLDLAACRAAAPFTYRDAHTKERSIRLEGKYDARPIKCSCCRWWHVLILRSRP